MSTPTTKTTTRRDFIRAAAAARAGAPFEQNAEVQPLTLHFRFGHVRGVPKISALCREALAKAQERGELPFYYGPGVMFLFGKDEVYVHGVRVPADPTNAADLSRAEMQGRADAHAMFRAWKKDVPAFADACFMEAYPWIGVRESRRIIGQHVLSEDDLMKARRFDDAIATGCWYLDLHPNRTVAGSANDFDPKKVQPDPTTSRIARSCRKSSRTCSAPAAAIPPRAARTLPRGSRSRRWRWAKPPGAPRRWR